MVSITQTHTFSLSQAFGAQVAPGAESLGRPPRRKSKRGPAHPLPYMVGEWCHALLPENVRSLGALTRVRLSLWGAAGGTSLWGIAGNKSWTDFAVR